MSRWSYKNGKMVARYQVTIHHDIPDGWFEYCHAPDLFYTDYCGYWMRGEAHDDNLGWLIYEHGGEGYADEETIKIAIELWKQRKGALPDGFIAMTDSVIAQAYQIAVRKWGIEWEFNADATSYDVIFQEALLGEVRYG